MQEILSLVGTIMGQSMYNIIASSKIADHTLDKLYSKITFNKTYLFTLSVFTKPRENF